MTTGQDGTDDDEIKIAAADGTTKLPSDSLTLDNDGNITLKTGTLAAGDRITITSGALVDMAGNKSRARTFTVMAAPKSPRITSVTMSNLNHTGQAAIAVPPTLAPQVNAKSVTVTAKKGGAADGAAGNGWNVVFDVPSSWKDDAKAAVDIGVTVSSKSKLVSVRFNSGKAKFGDLKSALEASDDNVRPALGLGNDPDAPAYPVMSRRFEAITSDAAEMPMARDLVTTASGYAGDDAATTAADESRNAASQVRIGQSSSVKAPS